MRLPSSFVQLNAAQEKKFFELLSLANRFVPRSEFSWEETIDKNTGLVKGLDMHWFHLTFEFIGNILMHKRYQAKSMLWHRGIERMTQHPVDYIYEYYQTYSKGKNQMRFDLSKNDSIWFLQMTEENAHLVLEMFDFCQTFCPLLGNKNITVVFNDNDMIEGTPLHWYQLFYNYIIPALIYHDKYALNQPHTNMEFNRYFGVVGNLTYVIRYGDPFKFVREMYKKRELNIAFLDKMEEHEYMKALNAREERRTEREKQAKAKNR